MKTIYVAGYPKSGTTWLTRLLGDALQCRTGASIPQDDAREPATAVYGNNPIIVRKGHFRLIQDEDKPLVPQRHIMNKFRMTASVIKDIVFIYRDPRAVAVSSSFYSGRNLPDTIDRMIRGQIYGLPAWDDYIAEWQNTGVCSVSYEALSHNTEGELLRILSNMGYNFSNVREVVERQDIETMRERIKGGANLPGGQALNLRLLREGKTDDWRNYLSQAQSRMMINELWIAQTLGYYA